ncbi:MAG: T9SS type A sorting domain-containing protein [Ferruginibacter sp.]
MKRFIHPGLLCFGQNYCIKRRYPFLILIILFSQQVFSQAPTIASFTPTSAATGTVVTITGTNFSAATAVSFGGTPATSFNVVSSTQITAVVASGTSGLASVTKGGLTGTKTGFYYLELSGIITDFAGYWPTTTATNNTTNPDDSHNLLAFTFNGITYSTGVNNSILTGQGISYTPGNFKSLPVANIAGINTGSSIYLAMASKVDGNAAVANASAVAGLTIKDVMTDGSNGLNMGTGITNLPISAIMSFDIHIINPAKILDAEPDILITQIASPSSGNDTFQFVNAAGVRVGNAISQDMLMLAKLGTYTLDLFNLSPADPFNSAIGFSTFATNTTRDIRLVGFKLSDFGITGTNYTEIAALKITPSGSSDYAFIAFNSDAIEMAPNIDPNVERTNSSICAGGTANLEVIATAAYGGSLTYSWERSIDGGASWSSVTNGGSYSGATTKKLSIVSATHNYQYRATVVESGTGFSSVSDVFTISVISPVAPTSVTIASTATTTCLNTLVSLSSTVVGGSNLFYQWQTNASGSYVDIPDAILRTYLPPVNATGVILYQVKVSSGSGCSGTKTSSPLTITVTGISSVTPASRCGTGVVSMSATATSGTISWYTASTGGSAVATGTTYSPTISVTTTFYLNTSATQCTSAGRVPVTATINTITWAGTNTIDWSTLANWDCGGTPPAEIPSSTNNITIPTSPSGGRFPTISDIASINNIGISSGASIIVAVGGTFQIYGSITNSGSFTATSGTISMRGSAQQTIPANTFTTNTIKNLTINNSTGVLLGGALNLTGTLTPTAGILTTFGHLTLISDSIGTARVAAGTGTYILGNVNVERYIPARRSWRLMTAPISNSNTIYQSWQNNGVYTPGRGMLVSAPGGGIGIDTSRYASMKTWNYLTQALVSVYNTQVPISATNTGSADNTSYFVFVRGDRLPTNVDHEGIRKNTTTLSSTGYLQTGTQRFTNLPSNAGAFALVGNPYASPIDLNLILSNAGTVNVKRKFYIWDPQLNAVGGYTVMDDVVTPGVFLPTPSTTLQGNYMQSGQAFFVITNVAGSAVLEVNESNKASSVNNLIFGRPVKSAETFIANLYLLNPAEGSTIAADGIRADFNEVFDAGIDDDDNLKCYNSNETFGLIRKNILLATERRPSIKTSDTLFFRLINSTKQTYQFQFEASFQDPLLKPILEDSYTGIPIPLELNGITKVNFEVNGDAGSKVVNRFRVIFSKSKPLPVTFLDVKGSLQTNNILVQWNVAEEINMSKYEVERSIDGTSFKKINTTSARGNNLSSAEYNCVDSQTNKGYNFYRIKSIGIDGDIQYSKVIKIKMDENEPGFSVYPNPVSGKVINMQFNNQPVGSYIIKITSTSGQLLVKKIVNHSGGSDIKRMGLPASIKKGNYQVSVIGTNLNTVSIKILVE